MAFKPKAPAASKDFVKQPTLEAGAYPARLWLIAILGTQKQRPYKGEEKPPVTEIALTYELQDEYMVDEDGELLEDKPRVVGEIIPFYSHEAEKSKCAKRYLALDPQAVHDGDWSELSEAPCMVTITVNQVGDKEYTNVQSISAMREKDVKRAHDLVNPAILFDFYEPDGEVWERMPNWLKEKCKQAIDYPGSALEKLVNGSSTSQSKPVVKEKAAPKSKPAPVADAEDESGEADENW